MSRSGQPVIQSSQHLSSASQLEFASGEVTCWGFAEPAAGALSQVRGLARAIGMPAKMQEMRLAFPWNKCWPGMIPRRSFIFRDAETLFSGPAPQLVITCAKQAIMASLWLKKRWGDQVFTVHIQDPRIDPRNFDLVIAPEHDGLTGPNIFASRGALHHINADVLEAAAADPLPSGLDRLPRPFVTVLLGGPNNCYNFDSHALAPLIAQLQEITRKQNISLAILPSRRTPDAVLQQFQQAFQREHFVWDRQSENPYLAALACCSHLIVTSDSVSMLSECAATEKPVYVFHLSEFRRSRRFHKFHQSFVDAGIARPFAGMLDQWRYRSPNPTQQIAELILHRLAQKTGTPHRSAA